MKKKIILVILLGFTYSVFGQMICGYEDSSFTKGEKAGRTGYIANGEVFTPRGDFRVLIIFVKYGGIYDTLNLSGWNNGDFPDWVNNTTEKVFYQDFSEFPQDIYSDRNRKSISNFYYQMSGGQFRLIADYYPNVITVDPSSTKDRGDFHKKVLEQIPNTFDWTPYDNRTNKPDYKFDNSNTMPDNIVDYIVFVHRFSTGWGTKPSGWLEKVHFNGDASTKMPMHTISSSSSMKAGFDGFTLMTGAHEPFEIFIHEVGHKIYDGPHYAGGNNVAGDYFYEPIAGWGMMHTSNTYACAAGWERYIIDWIRQISSSGESSDIISQSDLSATNGIFRLRDFITFGDAIRIRIPSNSDTYQYLWLENHQCVSTFDGNFRGSHYCESEIPEYKNGVVAYVESYSHVKDISKINLFRKGNGIRLISRTGDYDFTYNPVPEPLSNICGRKSFHFWQISQNSLGGQCVGEIIRHDFDNNGRIRYNEDTSGSKSNSAQNEGESLFLLNDESPTAKYYTGSDFLFHKGDFAGIAHNPCIKNIPQYDTVARKMEDFYLNGISFKILEENNDGSVVVKIRLDDVEIDQDVRWAAAGISLTDITGDNRPDVDVLPYVIVSIDKSGTPNRHRNPADPNQTFSSVEDFITPTTFKCRDNSFFKQEQGSTVNVKNQSRLVLEAGSVYEINDGAVLNIMSTGSLHVKRGATLRVKGAGHVEVQNGAYVCIEDGANIELVDELSAVNLRQGYQTGLNPTATPMEENGNCTFRPLTEFALAAQSQGAIHSFYMDNYIQNRNYTGNAYESGNKILAGHHITQQIAPGDVILEEGSHVILDADDEVRLEPGVEVQLGATLEVR